MADDEIRLRPAREGDGEAVFDVTRLSVAALSKLHYSPSQITNWMGDRTPAFYEALIAKGRMVVAERRDVVVGFVDAVPGEVTRLFLRPEVVGAGLGARLLSIGIDHARRDHDGPVRLEASLNAESFYLRHGFRSVGRGRFSHGLGGEPVEIVHMELSST